MSNELSIPSKPAFLAKQGDSTSALAEFAGGVTGGLSLPMLSLRAKVFRARLDGQEQELSKTRDLELILVAARPYISKRYFEGVYQSGSTAAPDCSSLDGKTPDSGENRQASKCGQCPHNVFGSSTTGKGKACGDYKRLVVLPIVNGKVVTTPCILDVPASSLKTPKALRGGSDLMLKEYMNTLARHQIDPTAVVSRIEFTGAEYPQITWAFSRYVEEDEYNLVQELRKSEEVQDVLGEDVHEEAGTVAPLEQPVVVKEAPKKAEPKPEPKPEPEPAQEASEPVTAPEPEAPATEESEPVASDDADILAEVSKMLEGMN